MEEGLHWECVQKEAFDFVELKRGINTAGLNSRFPYNPFVLGTTLGLVSIVGLDAKSAISWNFKWYYDKHAIIFYNSTHSMQTDCLQGSAVCYCHG